MKLIKRILKIVLFLILGLVVLLFGSIAVDGFGAQARLDQLSNLTIPGINGGPDVRAYVAKPEGAGPFPTVILIHEFFGLNESIVSKADLLAGQGYLVIAPDTFRGSTASMVPRAIYQVVTTKPENINADLDSVYAWLESESAVDNARVGVAGFCYGGRASLSYSLHNNRIAATVVFYGSPETDPEVLKNLPGPVLGIFGGADQSIPLTEVEAFERGLAAADIPHQVTVYEGQPHAFVQGAEGIQTGGAQAEAWNEMLVFLEANLKNRTSQGSGAFAFEYQPAFAWKYYAMLVYEHAFGSASHIH
jgi:carboxymethylenebutenolidase